MTTGQPRQHDTHDDQAPSRQAHASTELASRRRKALKIARLLGLDSGASARDLLEIGAGAGGISHFFATCGDAHRVQAVDVVDLRQVHEGYSFRLVPDVVLPFADASFDVVISNHVIEHVGDEAAQQRHLAEIRRVLRPQGCAYLAMPNRWMLIEPHYRLALLSWWPEAWRSGWLRLWRRGEHYDCRPLSAGTLERLIETAGLRHHQHHLAALRLTLEIERPQQAWPRRLLALTPPPVHRWLRGLYPTLIYTLHHAEDVPSSARRPAAGATALDP